MLLIMLCLITVILITNIQHKRKLEYLTRYQINVNANIDQTIPAILELIITESFNDYKIKYLVLDQSYINETKEAEIRKDLCELVSSRISEAALEKLSLFYNMANIGAIIADKIYIIVMDYVAAHNSDYVNVQK